MEAVFLPPGAQSVSTDADGQFQIEGLDPVVQAYYVQVVHPGYPRTSVSVRPAPAGQTRHEDIVLQAGATVFGQVTDPNGNSLEGVKVGNTRSPAMWNCITAYTDAQGQYRLEDVESGDLTLWAVPTRYALHVEHSAIEPGMAEKRLDIQLQEPTPLHGLVLYPPGAGGPVADVQVIISTFNGVSNLTDEGHTTGPDGRFVISNLPADGMVSFTCLGEGVHGSSQKFNIGQDKCFLTARRIGRIFGSVLADVTGQPIAPFTVKLGVSLVTRQVAGSYGIWFDEGCTFDSPLGLFDTGKAALPTGSAYRVTVQAEGYEPMIVDPVVAQPASENPNRTVFRLRPIEVLAGRVVSRDSQPIQGATVLFLSRNTGHQKEQFPRAVTDQTGVYTISGLGLGPQCLFVSAAGFAPRVCLMSDFLESPSHVGDIILDISPTIVGRVVDDNGNGILGMRVHASVDLAIAKNVVTFYPSLGPDAWTDSDGDYQLSDVPIGEVQISLIAADGYELERNRVTLEPAELSEVNFGGDGGHTVTGTVRAGDVSLENARISLRLESARRFQRKTDAEGQFRIGNVATGAYSLSILWRPGFADRPSRWPRQTLFTVDRTLHIDRNMKLEIDLEAETIEGF